jgi:hypothetical protein
MRGLRRIRSAQDRGRRGRQRATAVDSTRQTHPNVVLMDSGCPASTRCAPPTIPTSPASTSSSSPRFDHDEYVIEALDAGAAPLPAGPVPAGRGWTWPPPLGRDFPGPLRATRRGKADSPTPCTSRRGRTTPTAVKRYAGPRHGQGRSSSLRCGRSTLTPAPGRRSQAAAANGGKTAPTYTNPARPRTGVSQLNGAHGHADRHRRRSPTCAHCETSQTPDTRSIRVLPITSRDANEAGPRCCGTRSGRSAR